MFPVERQKRIREFIAKQHNVKISDLSDMLGVSEMTIHRDVKPLIEEGYVTKTFGGITLKYVPVTPISDDHCVICHKPINEKLAYRIILPGSIETACCAHCGLIRHHQLRDEVIQAICFDFLNQTTINASSAAYVMDTSINLGCCQPQVLSFNLKAHAEKFIKGFGGSMYTFNEAIEKTIMHRNGCSHSNSIS